MPTAVPLPEGAPDRLAALREEYALGGLDEADLDPDPTAMLQRWVDDAIAAELRDPTAMVLATVAADGRPSARTVLLKGLSERGLVFYTSYLSRKGEELEGNAACAAVLVWLPLQRQVRVEGRAEKLPDEESDAYFAGRPVASQLGAWASPQSQVVASREELERRYDDVAASFAEGPVPRPPAWGGYLIRPEVVEFWQGRKGRMHDRLRYRRVTTGPAAGWACERLAP